MTARSPAPRLPSWFRFRLVAVAGALLTTILATRPVQADGFIVIHDPPPETRVRGHFSFAPLEVTYHRVTVDVTDSVAVTTVDQEFYNPNGARLEGTYLFPLPEGTHIDKFSMDVNGKMQEAELLDAGKARAIYEDIVRKQKDPALLEYAGRSAFKVRIFPIEPNSRKPVKITYTQLLKTDSTLTEYVYPLNTEKFSSRPLQQVSVKVTLNSTESIKSLYCPSHNVEIRRDGERKATVGWEARNVRPDTDFKLVFSRTPKPLGIDLMTYQAPGAGEGYFLLLASPGMEAPKGQLQKKDVCFVVDTSGSMAENGGKKMEQAKKALSFCLQNLNEGDRFEVVRFSTEAEPLFSELRPADKSNVDKAQAFVAGLKPIGGTAISEALGKAMDLGKKRADKDAADRPYVVIFLTDGQPTIGETNEDSILAAMKKASGGPAGGNTTRVFSFGIGTDVNTHLLDRVASDTKAVSQYVLPDEDLEVKLSAFYTKIKEPVLANVEVELTGGDVKVSQLYPSALPDLFKGEQLILFGKYTGKGPGAVRIRGTLNGEKREFATDVKFAESDTTSAFIPRLWATRRVGYLLDEIRLRGESKELKDEVTRLAREHGIVTPYTAFLILEDEARRGVPVAMQTMRELRDDRFVSSRAAAQYDSAKAEASDRGRRAGDNAVANAKDVDALKQTSNLEQANGDRQQGLAKSLPQPGFGAGTGGGPVTAARPADPNAPPAATPAPAAGGVAAGPAGRPSITPEELGKLRMLEIQSGAFRDKAAEPGQGKGQNEGYRNASNYAQQARVVNGRAFYQNGNTWTDATAQAKLAQNQQLKQKQLKFNSDEYFALLKANPEAAQWLSLGEEVDVVLGDTLYQIRG